MGRQVQVLQGPDGSHRPKVSSVELTFDRFEQQKKPKKVFFSI
jgi:hypothetical protein